MTAHNKQQSVAIIGAGVVGICSAIELQRAGFQVTLFDHNKPGSGASYGNAGFLARELINPLADNINLISAVKMWLNPNSPLCIPPSQLLRLTPWLARFMRQTTEQKIDESTKALQSINALSINACKKLLADIDGLHFLKKPGYLLVWKSRHRVQEAKNQLEMYKKNGVSCELIKSERIRELEPELNPNLSHALYFKDAYQVTEPYQLCLQLFSKFIERGGVFIQEEITSIKQKGDKVCLKAVEGLHFNTAVLCAGVWSKELLKDLGLQVPLEAERGYHVEFRHQGLQLKHLISSAEDRFFISPLATGVRVVGISELGGVKLAPIKRRFQLLIRHSAKLVPKLRSEERQGEWMGHRSTLPDSLPVIDKLPLCSNILLAFGHQHLGLTQAAITAELITQIANRKETAIDIKPFAINRF